MDMKRTKYLFALSLLAALPAAAEVPFSGELRLRPEFRNNADFNEKAKDNQAFIGSRLRITGSGLAADGIAVKFTLQDTRNWGEDSPAGLTDVPVTSTVPLASASEKVDIHEAFVDFQSFQGLPFSLRLGRQELAFGDQRLVGHFGWSNQGRAFDAVRLTYSKGPFTMDAWTAKRQEVTATAGGRESLDKDFSGLYTTFKPFILVDGADFYVLHDREGSATIGAPNAKPKSVYTFGARVFGTLGPIDYTAEAPFQRGQNGTVVGVSSTPVKVVANALAVKAGWTIPGSKAIRIGGEYNYASGDGNSGDAKAKTFQNLYPTNHPYYGYMDYQGWRNMSAWNITASFKPSMPWFVSVHYWNFSLAQKKDGWYTAGGTALGIRTPDPLNTKKKVGSEIDFLVRFNQTRTVTWEAGVSRFSPGAYIKRKVPLNITPSNWAYLMLTTKF